MNDMVDATRNYDCDVAWRIPAIREVSAGCQAQLLHGRAEIASKVGGINKHKRVADLYHHKNIW
jgi:hypothetical protein